eukprot:m.39624 g.39624  ORF g.39624 m.39624 type:complete len:419 (-) comp12686_c0_seq3:148-1404(-)
MPNNNDYALAFGITAGAGMATLLGSAVVFVPRFYKPIVLGISLALAAGVMIYVSFIEIFFKGLVEFEAYFDDKNGVNYTTVSYEDYEAPAGAYHATTATFFAGILLTWLIDILIHWLYGMLDNQPTSPADLGTQCPFNEVRTDNTEIDEVPLSPSHPAHHQDIEALSSYRRNDHARDDLLSIQQEYDRRETVFSATLDLDESTVERTDSYNLALGIPVQTGIETHPLQQSSTTDLLEVHTPGAKADSGVNSDTASLADDAKRKQLLFTALITGVAISLHNFPEGLATFVATARDPSVGAPLAVAIAVHNIPEGICVAVPIYFASHSKWKAFLWGTLSGVAEPIAGAVGWGILSSTEDDDIDVLAYGVLFGLVAGMMVYISFRELLPTAHSYDPDDKYVTKTLFLGMLIMAASLMLFQT